MTLAKRLLLGSLIVVATLVMASSRHTPCPQGGPPGSRFRPRSEAFLCLPEVTMTDVVPPAAYPPPRRGRSASFWIALVLALVLGLSLLINLALMVSVGALAAACYHGANVRAGGTGELLEFVEIGSGIAVSEVELNQNGAVSRL